MEFYSADIEMLMSGWNTQYISDYRILSWENKLATVMLMSEALWNSWR
jgi:hypothetical protein